MLEIFLTVVGAFLIGFSISAVVVRKRHERKYVWQVAAAILGLVIILFGNSLTIIPTGYSGVRTTFGQIDEEPMKEGANWKIPIIQSVRRVNNKQQDVHYEDEIWSETASRTAIYYDNITVTYQINPDKSAWIYANVDDYRDNLVSNDLVSSAIKSTSVTLSDTDATKRSIIEPLAQENLQNLLDEKYGENVVTINKVTIGNADFEDSYNDAIAAKQQAQLLAEQQAIENQKAIDKAEADAIVAKTEAEAAAEVKLIEAQAEADANALLEESLSDRVLESRYIDKWDGQLPEVMTSSSDNSDGTSILFSISGLGE